MTCLDWVFPATKIFIVTDVGHRCKDFSERFSFRAPQNFGQNVAMFCFGTSTISGRTFAEHLYESFIDIPDDQLRHKSLSIFRIDINDIRMR